MGKQGQRAKGEKACGLVFKGPLLFFLCHLGNRKKLSGVGEMGKRAKVQCGNTVCVQKGLDPRRRDGAGSVQPPCRGHPPTGHQLLRRCSKHYSDFDSGYFLTRASVLTPCTSKNEEAVCARKHRFQDQKQRLPTTIFVDVQSRSVKQKKNKLCTVFPSQWLCAAAHISSLDRLGRHSCKR